MFGLVTRGEEGDGRFRNEIWMLLQIFEEELHRVSDVCANTQLLHRKYLYNGDGDEEFPSLQHRVA